MNYSEQLLQRVASIQKNLSKDTKKETEKNTK